MKNLSSVINGLLAIAVLILFILYFTGKRVNGNNKKEPVFTNIAKDALLPVAYVNVDTLLNSYAYAKEQNDALSKKGEALQATVNQYQKQIQDAQVTFNNNLKANKFLDEAQRDQEYQRIQKMSADYQQNIARLEDKFKMEQYKVTTQMTDSVKMGITAFNKLAHYQIILSNNGGLGTGTILFASEKYNITNDVLKFLNARYTPASK